MLQSFDFLKPRKKMHFLFLASHGLRAQLSSLRWAAGRLKKHSESLNREQKHLVSEIHERTRILSVAFNAMLLHQSIEDRTFSASPVVINLYEIFTKQLQDVSGPPHEWILQCSENMSVKADPTIVQSIVDNLFVLCSEAAHKPGRILLQVKRQDQMVDVIFYSKWSIPLLERESDSTQKSKEIGGTPGLTLSLAGELAQSAGGSVTLEEIPMDIEDLSDGTVEMAEQNAEYRIVLRLPAAP